MKAEVELCRDSRLKVVLDWTGLAELEVMFVLLGELGVDVLQTEDEVTLLVVGPSHDPVFEKLQLKFMSCLQSETTFSMSNLTLEERGRSL